MLYNLDQIIKLNSDELHFSAKEHQLLNIIQDLAIVVKTLKKTKVLKLKECEISTIIK